MSSATRNRRITPRTLQVIECLARGMSNPEIAKTLHIAPHNAQDRIILALRITGARDRVHLAYLYHHELFRIGLESMVKSATVCPTGAKV